MKQKELKAVFVKVGPDTYRLQSLAGGAVSVRFTKGDMPTTVDDQNMDVVGHIGKARGCVGSFFTGDEVETVLNCHITVRDGITGKR